MTDSEPGLESRLAAQSRRLDHLSERVHQIEREDLAVIKEKLGRVDETTTQVNLRLAEVIARQGKVEERMEQEVRETRTQVIGHMEKLETLLEANAEKVQVLEREWVTVQVLRSLGWKVISVGLVLAGSVGAAFAWAWDHIR